MEIQAKAVARICRLLPTTRAYRSLCMTRPTCAKRMFRGFCVCLRMFLDFAVSPALTLFDPCLPVACKAQASQRRCGLQTSTFTHPDRSSNSYSISTLLRNCHSDKEGFRFQNSAAGAHAGAPHAHTTASRSLMNDRHMEHPTTEGGRRPFALLFLRPSVWLLPAVYPGGGDDVSYAQQACGMFLDKRLTRLPLSLSKG